MTSIGSRNNINRARRALTKRDLWTKGEMKLDVLFFRFTRRRNARQTLMKVENVMAVDQPNVLRAIKQRSLNSMKFRYVIPDLGKAAM